jgi:hypothetical protein
MNVQASGVAMLLQAHCTNYYTLHYKFSRQLWMFFQCRKEEYHTEDPWFFQVTSVSGKEWIIYGPETNISALSLGITGSQFASYAVYCQTGRAKQENNQFEGSKYVPPAIMWLKFGGHLSRKIIEWSKKEEERGKREKGKKGAAGGTWTVSILNATLTWTVWLPLRELILYCHGNQENAVLPCNAAPYCCPVDQSDCNMTFRHLLSIYRAWFAY